MTEHGTFRTRLLRKLVSCLALLVFTGVFAVYSLIVWLG